MARSLPRLSPGEFQLLQLLWKLESATVAEVRAAAELHSGHESAYTTTMTILGRMVDKQAVRVSTDQRPYRYRPSIRKATFMRGRLSEFIEVGYGGDAGSLLQHLLEEGVVRESDVDNALADYRTRNSSSVVDAEHEERDQNK